MNPDNNKDSDNDRDSDGDKKNGSVNPQSEVNGNKEKVDTQEDQQRLINNRAHTSQINIPMDPESYADINNQLQKNKTGQGSSNNVA